MSTSLVAYEKIDDPMVFAEKMAKPFAVLAQASLEVGLAMAMTCFCENLNPMQFFRRYHFFNGKPTMRADAMRSEYRLNHGGEYEILEDSPDRAAIKFIDKKGKEYTATVTWEAAQKEPWPWKKDCGPGTKNSEPIPSNLKDNWATPLCRSNMLFARATTIGLRRVCPELVAGIYTPEEMEDVIDVDYRVVESKPAPTPEDVKKAMKAARAQAEEQAAASSPTGPDASVNDEGIVDAKFTVVEDSAPSSPAESSSLIARVQSLFDDLFPKDYLDRVLAKRSVQSLSDLDEANLRELLFKLEVEQKKHGDETKN